ncbi:hypothetical protein ACFOG5_24820 [Pedobacter fastidiosus]|uniref:hypothetical protein n=1 Tax=Pedobacter fastidiosus TaxID=2765361 RepID=UPI00361954C6
MDKKILAHNDAYLLRRIIAKLLHISWQCFNPIVNHRVVGVSSVSNRPSPVNNDCRVGEQTGTMLNILSRHIPSLASLAILGVCTAYYQKARYRSWLNHQPL